MSTQLILVLFNACICAICLVQLGLVLFGKMRTPRLVMLWPPIVTALATGGMAVWIAWQ